MTNNNRSAALLRNQVRFSDAIRCFKGRLFIYHFILLLQVSFYIGYNGIVAIDSDRIRSMASLENMTIRLHLNATSMTRSIAYSPLVVLQRLGIVFILISSC